MPRKKQAKTITVPEEESAKVKKSSKRKKRKPSKTLFRILLRTAVVLAVGGCTVLIISVQSDIAEKQNELKILQEQISAYETENEDLERILNSGDYDRYMEKLAREDYGYAYPDEFRFYDTSRN